jgi:hypothetical protein
VTGRSLRWHALETLRGQSHLTDGVASVRDNQISIHTRDTDIAIGLGLIFSLVSPLICCSMLLRQIWGVVLSVNGGGSSYGSDPGILSCETTGGLRGNEAVESCGEPASPVLGVVTVRSLGNVLATLAEAGTVADYHESERGLRSPSKVKKSFSDII